MTPFAAALAAPAVVFGLVIGSFLNVVAYRVPAGISLLRESRCPACDSPLRWWQNVPVLSWLLLRGSCAECRSAIPWGYPAIEATTGVLFGGVVVWWAGSAAQGFAALPLVARLCVLGAYLWFAASGLVLTVIDLATRRLPHRITGSALAVCAALLVGACLFGADGTNLIRAACGAGILFGFYAILRRAHPGGMGGGDVRLAAVTGLMLAWLGWPSLVVGAFAAFALGGIHGIALIALGKATRRTAVPFGPWIVAGSWIGIFAGEVIGRTYLDLIGVH